MGCGSHRTKVVEVRAEQKWDYINLQDFKSRGCLTPFAYGYLWFLLIISIAVYGVDTFTAVNLLVFNRWSSEIVPTIPFEYLKWIFSITIIASFVNLGFEQFRAFRVMKRGNVAECFLDDIAARLESIRMGKGQGFRRFLVFAELTKGKKGGEYIALFTYFAFKTWIQVLICSGPRQVVNALTLKSVYEAKLSTSATNVGDSFMGFFDKIRALAMENYQQALILGGMTFTLIVWIFSFLFLLAAVLFYVFFLWRWLPKADGGLSGYCERKVNIALVRIISTKVKKAIAKEQVNRAKAEMKAALKNGEKLPVQRQATLPTIPNMGDPDKLPDMPMISRTNTMTTLPPYSAQAGTPGSFELSSLDQKRPMPSRTNTNFSSASYSSRAPLMGGAADMGFGTPSTPAELTPALEMGNYPPPLRPGTSNSQRSIRPQLGHMQTNSSSSLSRGYTQSPASYGPDSMPPFPPPVRSPTARTMDSYNRPMPSSRPTYDDYSNRSDGRASPAPSTFSGRSGPPLPRNPGPPVQSPTYQPYRSATGPMPPRGPQYAPQRNMTAPVPPRQQPGDDYFSRPPTSQSQRPANRGPGYGYNNDVEAQRDQRY